jgi:integrase
MLYFILLTLARREEATHARWRDIDWTNRVWNISATKNGEPHSVPLSTQAITLLKEVYGDGANPDALIFSTSTGGLLTNWDRETKKLHEATETSNWHRHDLRRTAATILGNLGELPDIIEAGLNHADIRSSLAATYNRSRYTPQVRQALQRLGDYFDGISDGVVGKILPLSTRRV